MPFSHPIGHRGKAVVEQATQPIISRHGIFLCRVLSTAFAVEALPTSSSATFQLKCAHYIMKRSKSSAALAVEPQCGCWCWFCEVKESAKKPFERHRKKCDHSRKSVKKKLDLTHGKATCDLCFDFMDECCPWATVETLASTCERDEKLSEELHDGRKRWLAGKPMVHAGEECASDKSCGLRIFREGFFLDEDELKAISTAEDPIQEARSNGVPRVDDVGFEAKGQKQKVSGWLFADESGLNKYRRWEAYGCMEDHLSSVHQMATTTYYKSQGERAFKHNLIRANERAVARGLKNSTSMMSLQSFMRGDQRDDQDLPRLRGGDGSDGDDVDEESPEKTAAKAASSCPATPQRPHRGASDDEAGMKTTMASASGKQRRLNDKVGDDGVPESVSYWLARLRTKLLCHRRSLWRAKSGNMASSTSAFSACSERT